LKIETSPRDSLVEQTNRAKIKELKRKCYKRLREGNIGLGSWLKRGELWTKHPGERCLRGGKRVRVNEKGEKREKHRKTRMRKLNYIGCS